MAKPVSVAAQLGAVYDLVLVQARAVARSHGYALARHGSELRDLDLIAAPWTEGASSAEALAREIRDMVGGKFAEGDPVPMPHGRLAWSIHLKVTPSLLDACAATSKPFRPYLDLSVMPRLEGAVAEVDA